jgi:hypothetical protein
MILRTSLLFSVVFGVLAVTSGCSGSAQNDSEQMQMLAISGSANLTGNVGETFSSPGEQSNVSTVASSTDTAASGANYAIHDMTIDEAIAGTTNSGMTDVDARMGSSDNLTVDSRMQAADAKMRDAERKIDAAVEASRRAAEGVQ